MTQNTSPSSSHQLLFCFHCGKKLTSQKRFCNRSCNAKHQTAKHIRERVSYSRSKGINPDPLSIFDTWDDILGRI